MRRWLVTASFLAPLTISSVALADGNCPPGSWFCEEVTVQVPVVGGGVTVSGSIPGVPGVTTAPQADDETATSPDDSPESTNPPPKKKKKHKKHKKVQVETEVDESDDTVVVVQQGSQPPPYRQVVRKKKVRRWRERFGLNLRVEGAAFVASERSQSSAGMGGAGVSVRWRPSRFFAFDLGFDVLGGNDYNGDERLEVAGSLSGMLYFNPQHRVQAYAIAGINLSHAEVDTNPTWYDANNGYEFVDSSEGRNYFGGHAGLGVEVRLGTHFGLNADVLALIRTRVDSDVPEFRNPDTGETSNTSAAALFRIGANFWW